MDASASDKQRSSFVIKLHQLLSADLHPQYLHWVNNDTFAVTSVDAHARIALAPQWDFNSLSSFIRQLSYYSFKRLSDRRRSVERRPSVPSFIVFTHPSGNFVRDDESKALQIARKLRCRKTAPKRKTSTGGAGGSRESSSPTPVTDSKSSIRRPAPTPRKASAPDLRDSLHQYRLPPRLSSVPPPGPAGPDPQSVSPVGVHENPLSSFSLPNLQTSSLMGFKPPPEQPEASYPTPVVPGQLAAEAYYHTPQWTPESFQPESVWYQPAPPFNPMAMSPAEVLAPLPVPATMPTMPQQIPTGLVAPPSPPLELDCGPGSSTYGLGAAPEAASTTLSFDGAFKTIDANAHHAHAQPPQPFLPSHFAAPVYRHALHSHSHAPVHPSFVDLHQPYFRS